MRWGLIAMWSFCGTLRFCVHALPANRVQSGSEHYRITFIAGHLRTSRASSTARRIISRADCRPASSFSMPRRMSTSKPPEPSALAKAEAPERADAFVDACRNHFQRQESGDVRQVRKLEAALAQPDGHAHADFCFSSFRPPGYRRQTRGTGRAARPSVRTSA